MPICQARKRTIGGNEGELLATLQNLSSVFPVRLACVPVPLVTYGHGPTFKAICPFDVTPIAA